MGKGRIEAFSDGVLAIIITIMVLEMKVPHGNDWNALKPVLPVFFSYILSFIYIGIYWNNHHHMFHAVSKVNGKVLWANISLLFWLSLFPFVSSWAGENDFSTIPAILYGAVLFMAAISYFILSKILIKIHGEQSTLATALGKDFKGILSLILYIAGILSSLLYAKAGFIFYAIVALIWLIPDKRIENKLNQ